MNVTSLQVARQWAESHTFVVVYFCQVLRKSYLIVR